VASPSESPGDDRGPSRILAIGVLIPAVPLLLASVGALLAFYLAPARFNALLNRLPGDDLIRSALIFAPATLVAVIVMAVLYANEAPRREAAEATRPSARRSGLRFRSRGVWARRSLWVSLPLLVLAAAAQAIEFVAPQRVERLLDLLPATGPLTWAFNASPLAALAAVGLGLMLGFAPGEVGPPATGERGWTTARIARLGAQLTLLPALGLLVLSGAGLAWVGASPDRLEWLTERLPAETLLRLVLAFAPAMFLGIVLLAGLYLTAPSGEERPVRQAPPVGRNLRSGLALGVLIAGLGFTVVIGTAVLAAAIFVVAAS
jgi:hypothetical protein